MRRTVSCILCAALLFLTGCVANVELLIVPPTPAGQQQAIKQALDDYILATYDTNNYLLQYPTDGAYTSAFITLPGNNGAAVVFYRLRGEQSGNIHVHLLRRSDDGWQSVGDVEGLNTSVEEVGFADLNGDGVNEMLVGWSVYNSNDRSLYYCTLGPDSFEMHGTRWTYTQWHTCDLTGDSVDDLILLRYSAEGRNTARLLTLRGSAMSSLGEVRIDGYIREVVQCTSVTLSESVKGLYIDARTGGDALITELLCWDGGQLTAPFYVSESNSSPFAARKNDMLCVDVNGDGTAEIPVAVLLEGYSGDAAPSYAWRVDWCTWSYEEKRPVRSLSCISFDEMGYVVYPLEEWYDTVTTRYDKGQGILWVLRAAGEPVIAVSVGKQLPKLQEYTFKEWHRNRQSNRVYGLWYDRNGGYITADTIDGVVALSQTEVSS